MPATCSDITSPTADSDSPASFMCTGVIVITATIATLPSAIAVTPVRASGGQEGSVRSASSAPVPAAGVTPSSSRALSSGSGRSSTNSVHAASR